MKNQIFTYLGDKMHGTCLVSASETEQTFSLFHVCGLLGANVPPHVHHNEDEAFYVLSGTFDLQIGERRVSVEPGCAGFGPRDVPHAFTCTSERGELLVMTFPGGFEAFFTALEAHGPLPVPPTPEDIEGFFALLGRFGMTPAAPLPEGTPIEALPVQAHPERDYGNHRVSPKLLADETSQALFLREIHVDTGGGVLPQLPAREDETFYVLSGRFDFSIGEATLEAGPGKCVYGPRGIAHTWRCTSPEGGRLLSYVTPKVP